jgi:hypothetical protein
MGIRRVYSTLLDILRVEYQEREQDSQREFFREEPFTGVG